MENLPEDANPSSSINTKSYDESRDDSDFAVFLGDLNKDASEDDIRSILEKYGNVVDVNIMKSKQTGHPLVNLILETFRNNVRKRDTDLRSSQASTRLITAF